MILNVASSACFGRHVLERQRICVPEDEETSAENEADPRRSDAAPSNRIKDFTLLFKAVNILPRGLFI